MQSPWPRCTGQRHVVDLSACKKAKQLQNFLKPKEILAKLQRLQISMELTVLSVANGDKTQLWNGWVQNFFQQFKYHKMTHASKARQDPQDAIFPTVLARDCEGIDIHVRVTT